jgi:DNA-binding transcriptional ArsR family regulator
MHAAQLQDGLSQTFAALADPTRRAMLVRLSQGEASVSDLAQPFRREMSLPAITKHLKVLEAAGLVAKTRQAQWRRCRLQAEALRNATDWMEQYRVFWEESFDRLEAYLNTVTAEQRARATGTGASAVVTKSKSRVSSKSKKKMKVEGKQHGRKK